MSKSADSCLFCQIIDGKEPSKKVWENQDFLAIVNKYPTAKIHVLVMPKVHQSKISMAEGGDTSWYGPLMEAVYATVRKLGIENKGYKLVNNGGGYNHFDHEHIHVLGGSKTEPGGST